jgi:tRNA uridine 5-carbamoylmethylation protein Kti12
MNDINDFFKIPMDSNKREILDLLDKQNKVFVIMRGLPGSGKSTFARELMNLAENHCVGGMTKCSADHYFVRPDGTYDWNPKMLKNAHEWCFDQVEEAMSDINAWSGDCQLIILDNTNIIKSHYKKYVELAELNGYIVKEVVIGNFDEDSIKQYKERNEHGVSLETIQGMAKKFER